MKTVLYVLPKSKYFSEGKRGRVSHAMGVVRGLAKNGVKVSVLSGRGIGKFLKDSKFIDIHKIRGGGNGLIPALRWMVKLKKKMKYIIENKKKINNVLIRYSVSNSYIFSDLPYLYRECRWIYEVNSLAYHQFKWLPKIIRQGVLGAEKKIINNFDKIYTVSTKSKKDIEGDSKHIGNKVLCVPNGGPPPKWDKIREGEDSCRCRFVYLGVFQEYYEFKVLIQSFSRIVKRYRSVGLSFYGYGPEEKMIEVLSQGVKNVHLEGEFESIDNLIYRGDINKNDILLLPYKENTLAEIGSPIKMGEYMSLGLPIIASDVGQPARILGLNDAAILYNAGENKSLTRAMRELVIDKKLRQKLSKRIRKMYCDKFTWSSRMAKLIDHLK